MDQQTNWRGMFEDRRPPVRGIGDTVGTEPRDRDEPPEDERSIDPSEYRPWVLQRGRSRPALMLDLRRFDARAGMWMGWAVAYPQLAAVEYVGERMLSLDFGPRKFVLEGDGLSQLVTRLQQGGVLAIHEYSDRVWSNRPAGPMVTAIRRAGQDGEAPSRG